MANEVTTVDPLGNTIHLLPVILFSGNEAGEIHDHAVTAIQKPAIFIKTNENSETKYHYFRSVGWNNILLITVRFKDGRWEAYKCIKNPPKEILSAILKKGKQLL